MPSKTILPLSLLLISACAQVPNAPTQGIAQQPAPQSSIQQSTTQQSTARQSEAAVDSGAPVSATPAAVARPARSAASVDTAVQGPAAVPASRAARASATPRIQPTEPAAETPATTETATPALPPKNVWDRIRTGFAMTPIDNDLVRDWENWYANRPDYVARMIDRSSRFLFHIVEEVEKRKMPMEVALLPMIESAYNPVAYSRSHASGIWQFIPSTGKDFGLRQNWWYDGRRDVIAATGAALDYLEKLYGMFGDWNLALASYNWGEGAVGRAIERNRAKGLPTDYEHLTMPAETRNYLPKLMAVKNIISNPARYGLQIADVPNEPYFETVTVKRHIDVKVAAKLAEMSLDEFKFLNPGHNKPVIRAGEAERIVLPKHKVATFVSNLGSNEAPLVSWQAVTLRAGEKAEKVAAQHGMTLAELKQVNGLAHQRKIVTGQPLLVPLKGGAAEPTLPDIPVNPVPLQKAIQAAKLNAHSKRYVRTARGGKAVVQKAAQRGPVHKGKKPVQRLRAETGKRVKVVIPSKPASSKKAVSRTSDKVAAR
jgi:membrane-bound lytic murein transglycosylase D